VIVIVLSTVALLWQVRTNLQASLFAAPTVSSSVAMQITNADRCRFDIDWALEEWFTAGVRLCAARTDAIVVSRLGRTK